MLNLMLRFHNVSAYLVEEAPRISRIDTYLFNSTTDYGQQTTDFINEERKDSCKFA